MVDASVVRYNLKSRFTGQMRIISNRALRAFATRFEKQIVYVKAVLTHRDYDQGTWKS